MDRSNTNRAPRLRPLGAKATALALLTLLGLGAVLVPPAGAEPGNDNREPVLTGDCAKLAVEAGHKVAFHTYAAGVQVYRWNGSNWAFVGPEAVLFADDGGNGVVGIHYGGPTWESESGSKVVAAVVDRSTPDPTAIPWLLLKATSAQGPGIFHRITYIQRVNTVGGKAPTEPGDFVGEEARVPYTADYFFYRAQD